jgi:hypothetical protein
MMIGRLRMNWPMIIAPGVKRRFRAPSGPCRSSRIERIKPTTTGGSPKPVLQIASRTPRPRNFALASQTPKGTPTAMLASVAVTEISSDWRMTAHVSVVAVSLKKKTWVNP